MRTILKHSAITNCFFLSESLRLLLLTAEIAALTLNTAFLTSPFFFRVPQIFLVKQNSKDALSASNMEKVVFVIQMASVFGVVSHKLSTPKGAFKSLQQPLNK